MRTFVYAFSQGNKDLQHLLGGKGANLAEMTRMGLPVPPGPTITTEASQALVEPLHPSSATEARVRSDTLKPFRLYRDEFQMHQYGL